jgi:phytoene dehydrogenase-like protein
VAIVGGGLAGLCCARRLIRGGVDVRLFEAADRLGGRVASDRVDGFIVDRGFQVLLTAYAEARSGLDLERLRLHRFYSGALVYCDGRLRRLADPRRHPVAGLRSALSPLLTFRDLPRLALLRTRLRRIADGSRPAEDVATGDYLRRSGFSERAIERFFRPFFGGVFLEHELDTPLAKFAFVFTMFARGPAALPEGGIEAIPAQVAEALPETFVATGRRVEQVDAPDVVLAGGERVRAAAVVVATDAASASALMPDVRDPGWNATATLSFAAPEAPIDEPILALDGAGEGPVNHLCVPSRVAPTYAPPGMALVSANVLGAIDGDDDDLETAVRTQLRGWFGSAVDRWRLLRVDRIRAALPRGACPSAEPERAWGRLAESVYICGDHLDGASINGAMRSGRLAAEAVLADLGIGADERYPGHLANR